MKYPKPLQQGSTIAITAFSSGIEKKHDARFRVVRDNLESRGFNVVVGKCLYGQNKHVSAPAQKRADELMSFLMDDEIDAIYPPWGGQLAIELLPLIDFAKLQTVRPKWILGFSDVSTIAAVFASKLKWATAHCSNLMDLTSEANDPLTANTLTHLSTATGGSFSQTESKLYASSWPDIVTEPTSGIMPDTPTNWKWLVKPESGSSIEGRLIGGCWDTLSHLFETEYLDLKGLSQRYSEGIVLYLENAEMSPTELARTILSMKFRGVFSCSSGLLLGRSAAAVPKNDQSLSYYEVLEKYLMDIGIPVMIDLDIGHVPPNLTLINGAIVKVELNETGILHQYLK